MLVSRESAGRNLVLAAAAVAIAFATAFALPHAAWAYPDEGVTPQAEQEGSGTSGGDNGSSDDAPSGGADEQGGNEVDSQQGAGIVVSTSGSEGVDGTASQGEGVTANPVGAQTSAPADQFVVAAEGEAANPVGKVGESETEEPPATYTITFSDGVEAMTAAAAKEITMPTAEKDGYTLKGWALADEPDVVKYEAGKSYAFTADTKLVAVWESEGENADGTKADAKPVGIDGLTDEELAAKLATAQPAKVRYMKTAVGANAVQGIDMTTAADGNLWPSDAFAGGKLGDKGSYWYTTNNGAVLYVVGTDDPDDIFNVSCPWDSSLIEEAHFSNWAKPQTISSWFRGSKLTKIDFAGLDLTYLQSADSVFSGSTSLVEAVLYCGTGRNPRSTEGDPSATSTLQSFTDAFSGCSALQMADWHGWDTRKCRIGTGLLSGCDKATTLKGSQFWRIIGSDSPRGIWGARSSIWTGASSGIMGKYRWIGTPDDEWNLEYLTNYDELFPFLEDEAYVFELIPDIPAGGMMSDMWSSWYYAPDSSEASTGTLHICGNATAPATTGSTFDTNDSAPWHNWRNNITNVVFDNYPRPISMVNWFNDMSNITKISLDGIDLSALEDAHHMIRSCNALLEVDLTPAKGGEFYNNGQMKPHKGDTGPSPIGGLVQYCSSLTTFKMTGWDFSGTYKNADAEVTPENDYRMDMHSSNTSWSFRGCSSLSKLILGPRIVLGTAYPPVSDALWKLTDLSGTAVDARLQKGDIVSNSVLITGFMDWCDERDLYINDQYGVTTWEIYRPERYIILDGAGYSGLEYYHFSDGRWVGALYLPSKDHKDGEDHPARRGVFYGVNQRVILPSQFNPIGYYEREYRFFEIYRKGYSLIGWKYNDDITYAPGHEFTLTNNVFDELFGSTNGQGGVNSITLRAIWAPDVTVRYYGNGSNEDPVSLAEAAQTGANPSTDDSGGPVGSSYTLATNPFMRPGYTFAGWVLNKNEVDDENGYSLIVPGTSQATFTITDDIISSYTINVYAIWSPKGGYRVSYDVNGGVGTFADKTRDENGAPLAWNSQSLIPDTEPTKANHDFLGWYVVNAQGLYVKDRNGEAYYDNNNANTPYLAVTLTQRYRDLTSDDSTTVPLFLKAVWEERQVVVTYNADSKSRVKVQGQADSAYKSSTAETTTPLSNPFAGAVAKVDQGLHAAYWLNDLYPNKRLYGTNTYNAADGTVMNELSLDEIRSVSFFAGEWHDVTFTLVTASNKYTLSFDPNGGDIVSSLSSVTADATGAVLLPDATGYFQKAGYVFGGWANARSERDAKQRGFDYQSYQVGYEFRDVTVLDGASVVLYALWSEPVVSVTFRADYPEGYVAVYEDDGQGNLVEVLRRDGRTADYVQQMEKRSGTVIAPTAVAHEGYRFLYWVNDQTQQVVSTEATWAPSQEGGEWPESAAYRAKFEPRTYAVAFNANGGAGAMANQAVTYGTVDVLSANAVNQQTALRAISRAGYQFAGWATEVDEDGKAAWGAATYADQGQIRVDSTFLGRLGDDGRTLTLYALWAPRTMQVRYNAGAVGVSDAAPRVQQVQHEVPVTLAANSFRRYGYSFAGWSRTFEGAKAYDNRQEDVTFSLLTDGTDINLYALWERVTWKVAFENSDADCGTISPDDTLEVLHGDAVGTEPAVSPNKVEGVQYLFMNWDYVMQVGESATKTGSVLKGDLASFEVLGPVTFTAVWGPSRIFVRYDPGNHGAFTANLKNYTFWDDIQSGLDFNPNPGQGGYSYNGGLDDATTNAANIGNPMGEPGWVFDHWSWYDEDGVYRTSKSSAFPAKLYTNYTFVAHWTPAGAAITFDANGGAPTSEFSLDPVAGMTGALVRLHGGDDVARAGYYFRGWSTNAEGPVEYAGGAQLAMPGASLHLFAQWDPYLFRLHFDTRGGTAIDDSIGLTYDSQYLLRSQADSRYFGNIENADAVSTTKPGYEFKGWYASVDDMDFPHLQVTDLTVLKALAGEDPEDGQVVTIYAKWAPVMSVIKYATVKEATDPQAGDPWYVALSNSGAQVQPDAQESVEAATGEATPHTAVAGPGFVFLYWADALGHVLSRDAEFTPSKGAYDPDAGLYGLWAGETTYYAVFDIVKYAISFDANGGTGSFDALTGVEYDAEVQLPSNAARTMDRLGYAFVGWATAADGTGTLFDDGAKVKNLTDVMGDEVVLYARWAKADQVLVFHENVNGERTLQIGVLEGQTVRLPGDSLWAREHYSLVGWNTEADGSGTTYVLPLYASEARYEVPGAAVQGSARIVNLYALWKGIGYTVRFAANADDATGMMGDQQLEYGVQERLEPNAYVRQGYTFVGWANSAVATTGNYADGALVWNLTDVEGAVVRLYAVWAANANLVTFGAGAIPYGTVTAYDQHVSTGGHAAYGGAVAVAPNDGYSLAGWSYEVYADGSDAVIASGVLMDPSELTITGRTAFTARWSVPLSVQYLPGAHGAFSPWTSEQLWAGAVVPDAPASVYGSDGTPRSQAAAWVFRGWRDQNGATYEDYAEIRGKLTMTAEGWIFEALWQGVYVVQAFNANGGKWADEAPVGTRGLTGEDTITLPLGDVLARRPGYTFDGWSTAQDGGTVYAPGAEYLLNADVPTLWAHWEPKLYTVYYNVGLGVAIAHSMGVTWDDYVATTRPEWDSIHTFLGWANEQDATAPTAGLDAESLNLAAVQALQTQAEGDAGITLGDLLRALGIIDANGNGDDSPQSITLYAVWKTSQAAVTYAARDARGTLSVTGQTAEPAATVVELYDVDAQPVGAGVAASLGYHFIGWYDGEADGAVLLSADPTWKPTSSAMFDLDGKTFWAWFAPNTYTVVFKPNSAAAEAASAGMAPQVMTYNQWEELSSLGLSIVNPGFSFAGWNTAANGSGKWYSDGQLVKNLAYSNGATVELFAQWVAGDYFVDFDKNAKDAYGQMDRQAFYYGTAQGLSELNYWRNGYTFLGWARSADAETATYTDKQSLNFDKGASGQVLTLYAVWGIANDYTLEFVNAEGAHGTVSYSDGASDTSLVRTVTYWASPGVNKNYLQVTADEGYAFAGWQMRWKTRTSASISSSEDHYSTIRSYDPDSINTWVISGYETYATPIWEKLYKVTYVLGDEGAIAEWTPGYYLSGSYVPTFDTNMTDDQKAAYLYTRQTANGGTSATVAAPKAAQDTVYAFAGWYDQRSRTTYKTWDDLQGLRFGREDITLQALWTDAYQKITYYKVNAASHFSVGDGESFEETVKVRDDHTLLGIGSLTDEYYTLIGWSTTSGGAKVYELGEKIVMPAEPLNLYAVWMEKTAIIKYKVLTGQDERGKLSGWGLRKDADGVLYQEIGVRSGNSFDAEGRVISKTPLPVYANANSGYSFEVWLSEDSADAGTDKQVFGSSPYIVKKNQEKGVYEAATYWAMFVESDAVQIKYEVGFITDPGTGAKAADAGWVTLTEERVDPNTGEAVGSTAEAYAGWTFVGWYEATGTTYRQVSGADAPTYVPVKSSGLWTPRTYVAMFKAAESIEYRVEYWLEGSDGTYALPAEADPANPAYYYIGQGEAGKTVSGDATKRFDGYEYNREASRATVSATLAAGEQSTLVLYYSRTRPTVVYQYQGAKPGGAPLAPETAAYRWGETVTLADAPELTGYVFSGWELASGSASVDLADDGTFTMPQGTVRFVGTWTPVLVTMTFDPNGGQFAIDEETGAWVEAVQPKTYVAGTPFNLPDVDDVSYAGYVLVGWSTDPNGDIEFTPGQSIYMPYDLPDVKRTMYALWRERLVKVQFDQVVRKPSAEAEGGWAYEAASGMIRPVGAANLIVEDGKLSMLVGASTGRVYGYYASTQVEALAPYQVEADPGAGYAFVLWKDEAGDTYATTDRFTLRRGADGLFQSQVYTAVFSEADDVVLYFKMVDEDGAAVNAGGAFSLASDAAMPVYGGSDAALQGSRYQALAPASGTAQSVTVVGEAGGLYTFVGWYRAAIGSDGTVAARNTWTLVAAGDTVLPARNDRGLYESAAYFAVFHDMNSGKGSYTVRHWLQEVAETAAGSRQYGYEGWNTTPAFEQQVWGNVGDAAQATAMALPGFALNTTTSQLTGGVLAAGVNDIVLDLFYDRLSYVVIYAYTGTAPAGASPVPGRVEVRYGQTVAVEDAGIVAGHSFIGWTSSQVAISRAADGSQSFVMPASAVQLTGYFEANAYTVQFTAAEGEASVSGAGAVQGDVRYGTPVHMADPSNGAEWVVVAKAPGNDKVQYGWNYTVTDEDGNVLAADVFVYDPATLTVSGNMTFVANFIDGFTVAYLPGEAGAFAEGAGKTVFAGLTPADLIGRWASYNSDSDADGLPLGRQGYRFVAWSWTDPETQTTLRSDVVGMPAHADADYEFTALWESTTRTLTFNVNGGAWATGADPNGTDGAGQARTINAIEALPGSASAPDDLATRAGWHIVGWGASANGDAQYALGEDFTMPAADTTLYLIWAEDDVTIYYVAGDGGAVSVPTETVKSSGAGAAGAVAVPKSGRVFAGWVYVGENGDVPLVAGANIVPDPSWFAGGVLTDGMTFKALFAESADKVTIRYEIAVLDIDGNPTSATIEAGGYVADDSEELLPVSGRAAGTTAIAYAGYRLLHWIDASGNVVGPDYADGNVATGSIMPPRNADGAYESTTYTAVFQKLDEVMIKFDANASDAENIPAGVKAVKGEKVDPRPWSAHAGVDESLWLEDAAPARPGYTFLGWSTDKGAKAPDQGLGKDSVEWTAPDANTTLFAVWQANSPATVTLDAGEGAFATEQGASKTHEVTEPEGAVVAVSDLPAPTRAGYTFLGWSASEDANKPDEGLGLDGSLTVAEKTLHAVWQANDDTAYTIVYYKVSGDSTVEFDRYDGTGTTGEEIDAIGHDYTTTMLARPAGYALRAGDVKGFIAGDGGLELHVYFDAGNHMLSVSLDGGKLTVDPPSGAHKTDEAIALPTKDDISKDGYTFAGWKLTWNDGTDAFEETYDPSISGQDSFAMPAYDATLTALWTPNADTPYTIKYYKSANGVTDADPFETFAASGTTGELANALTHAHTLSLQVSGYTLRAGQAANATGYITGDGLLVLEVYFDAKECTVSFNATDGSFKSPQGPVTLFAGQQVALPTAADMNAPVGKHLAGWRTAADAAGTAPYTTAYAATGDSVELLAVWADNDPVRVVLIAGEGLFANGLNSAALEAAEGSAVDVKDMPKPERAGYTLLGWSESQTASGPDQNLGLNGTWTVTATTLYAVWQAKIDIDYKIEYYTVTADGSATKFAEIAGKGTTGNEVDAIAHAKPSGFAVPAGYSLHAGDVKGAITGDGNLVLKVYYDADTFAVTVDLKGGALDGFAFDEKYATDSIVALPNKGQAKQAGYELTGWKVTWADNSTATYDPGASFTMLPQTATVEAVWNSLTSGYTVNYVKRWPAASGMGDDVDTTLDLTAPTGTLVKVDVDFAKLSFPGFEYYAGNVGQGTVTADGKLVITLYYDAMARKVIYDLNVTAPVAGTEPTWRLSGDAKTYVQDTWSGATVTVAGAGADAPSRAGYAFKGWATTAAADKPAAEFDPGTKIEMAASDVALFAVWQAFKVVLAFEGGTDDYIAETPVGGSKDSINTEVGATVPLGSAGFTRPGYTFDGWYRADDAAEPKTLFNGDFTVGPVATDGATLTLKAKWTPKEYEIVYKTKTNESGNASIVVRTEKVRFNQKFDDKLVWIPTLTGYDFSGWNTSTIALYGKTMLKDRDFAFLAGGNDSTASVTVNGLWKVKKVTITYMKQNVKVFEAEMAWNATGIDSKASGEADGYTFKGWNTSAIALLGKKITPTMTVGEMMGNNDSVLTKTLYATLTAKYYTIEYDTLGGLSVAPKSRIQWSSNNLVPASAQRDGFEFAGWWTKDGTGDGDWGSQVTSATRYSTLRAPGDDDVAVKVKLYAKWNDASASPLMGASSVAGKGASVPLQVAVAAPAGTVATPAAASAPLATAELVPAAEPGQPHVEALAEAVLTAALPELTAPVPAANDAAGDGQIVSNVIRAVEEAAEEAEGNVVSGVIATVNAALAER